MSHTQLNKPVLAACMTLIALSGMSPAAQAEPEKAQETAAVAPPIVAVVNGVEITRKELDYLYSLNAAPHVPPEVAANMKRRILADLVRSEVLAQRAVAQKLDSKVDQELESRIARRRSLAAIAERDIMRQMKPASGQTALDFVNKNPHMFAERRMLTLEELRFDSDSKELLDTIDKSTEKGAGVEKLEEQIRAAKGKSERKVYQMPTDKLPGSLVSPLTAKPPQPVVVKFNDDTTRGSVLFVRASVAAPVVGREALQAAGMTLNMRQLQSTQMQGMQSVLGAAKISYWGEYAGGAMPTMAAMAPGLNGGKAYAPQISRTRKAAITAGIGAASMLSVMLLITGWRYWVGSRRRAGMEQAPAGNQRFLRRIPLLSKLLPQASHAEVLAATLASSRSAEGSGSRWYGKLLLLLGMGACAALLGMQGMGAWNRLPAWVVGTAGAGGLLAGSLLAVLYSRTRLRELGGQQRWIPAAVTGLLMLGVSAAGIAIA